MKRQDLNQKTAIHLSGMQRLPSWQESHLQTQLFVRQTQLFVRQTQFNVRQTQFFVLQTQLAPFESPVVAEPKHNMYRSGVRNGRRF